MLLRKVRAAHPTPMTQRRGEFPQITAAHHPGGLNQKEWSDTLKAAKAALDAGDREAAGKLYSQLYFDLAATARAVTLRDVANGAPINVAKGNDIGFAPGLNLVLGSGASKAASTGVRRRGRQLRGRVRRRRQGGDAADRDPDVQPGRSRTTRRTRCACCATRCCTPATASRRSTRSRAASRRRQTDVDKAVVRDIKLGGSANTELLAYVEGFMTAFHLTAPPLRPQHPLFIDLLGMLETTKVDPWLSAHESVRDEALGRLREYYCNTMDAAHRAAFDAWVASLEAQVAKDAQAIKSGAGGGAAITAKRNAERMFDHFAAGMKEVATMACAARAGRRPG